MTQSETSFPVTTGLVKEFVNVDSRGFALGLAVTAMVYVALGGPQKAVCSQDLSQFVQSYTEQLYDSEQERHVLNTTLYH